MTLLSPLGLLGLLAVPAVLALHLFRRRLERRKVAGLFLFADDRLLAEAGRRRTRLLQSTSLWLELLAAVLLALWLAGPSFGARPLRHFVAVLDDSASMGAIAADGSSARDRALVALRARLGELGGDDRATLLRSGPRPSVLVGPAVAAARALAAAADWQPRQPTHDLGPSLDLARELAGGDGEVVLFSDRAQPTAPIDITVVATGAPASNAALLSANRWRRDDGGERLRLVVQGYGGLAQTGVTVRQGTLVLQHAATALAAEPTVVTIDLPPTSGELDVSLDADALAIDDRWLLLPEPRREVAVCVLLDDATRAALRLDAALAAQELWRSEADPRRAELVIAASPGRARARQVEFVVAPAGEARDAYAAPFVVDAADPLLLGSTCEGVVWVAGRGAVPGRPVLAVGDAVLIAREDEADGVRYRCNLDPRTGNFVRAPDWPIVLQNLLAIARREVPGVDAVAVALGQEVRYRHPAALAAAREPAGDGEVALQLVGPDGTRTAGRPSGIDADATVWLPTQVGRHSVRDAGDRELAAFAVAFRDAGESDLAGAATQTRAATPRAVEASAAGTARDAGRERRVLAMLVVLVVAIDWLLLGRRRS